MKNEELDLCRKLYNSNIENVLIDVYVGNIMRTYGMNVSVFRSCPSLEDGLTPVRRRILYSMYKLGLFHNKPMTKLAAIAGETSKIHPHADTGKQITGLNIWYEYFVTCLEGHGNFANAVSDDPPASIRYLDGRLSFFAYKCYFEDFDLNSTDTMVTYLGTELEPITLSSKYPSVFLIGSMGIGWGVSASIPGFNFIEVCRLTQKLLDDPNMENVYLYPDSPKGFDIIDDGTIFEVMDKGEGSVKCRGVMKYIKEENIIKVYNAPYCISTDTVMDEIANLIKNKEIIGISDLRDDSKGDNNTEFSILLKRNADPDDIMDKIWKRTKLSSFISIQFNYSDKVRMLHYGLKDTLLEWILRRMSYKQRYYSRKLKEYTKRYHVVEALLSIPLVMYDDIIKIVKESNSDEETIEKLVKRFKCYGLTTLQASYINELQIKKLNKSSLDNYIKEKERLKKEISRLTDLIMNDDALRKDIYMDLEEGIKLFGRPRCCNIVKINNEENVTKYNIVITERVIKKMSRNSTSTGQIDSSDKIVTILQNVPSDDKIFIIDTTGTIYSIKVNKIPLCDSFSKGSDLNKILSVKEKTIFAFNYNLDDDIDDLVLTLFTSSGAIKKSPLNQYTRTNKSEFTGIILNENDEICYASINKDTTTDLYELIYTNMGNSIAINLSMIPIFNRVSKGTNYLQMNKDDCICGVCEMNKDKIFVITNKGYCKIILCDSSLKTDKRREKMSKIIKLEENDSVYKLIPIDKNDTKVIINLKSGEKEILELNNIPISTRIARGKKMINVKQRDSILKVFIK